MPDNRVPIATSARQPIAAGMGPPDPAPPPVRREFSPEEVERMTAAADRNYYAPQDPGTAGILATLMAKESQIKQEIAERQRILADIQAQRAALSGQHARAQFLTTQGSAAPTKPK